MAIKLFTSDQVAVHMGIDGLATIPADNLQLVEDIINSIVSRVEKWTCRKLEYNEYTEYVSSFTNADQSAIYLRSQPIESITSITPRKNSAYDVNDAIDLTKIYFDEGKVVNEGTTFNDYYIYKVVYQGGYDDWQSVGSSLNNVALPDDLAMAILKQFRYEFENRNSAGIRSQSTEGESITKETLINGFLPDVWEIIEQYQLSWL